jgi:hypothetical protein
LEKEKKMKEKFFGACLFLMLVLACSIFGDNLTVAAEYNGTDQYIDQAIEDIRRGSQYAPQFLRDMINDGIIKGVDQWKIDFLIEDLKKPKRVLVDPYPRHPRY